MAIAPPPNENPEPSAGVLRTEPKTDNSPKESFGQIQIQYSTPKTPNREPGTLYSGALSWISGKCKCRVILLFPFLVEYL
jgi:hypothetical protein